MSEPEQPRPPLPPFDLLSASQKVRMAEDAWNTRDPERVSQAYTSDSVWRNRSEFLSGRKAIVQFLTRKWNKELNYRLIKELWAFHENRIAVRFAYEWHDDSGNWFRSYGNENWSLTSTALCADASPALTIYRFKSVSGSTIGLWGVVRMIILGCRSLACEYSTA